MARYLGYQAKHWNDLALDDNSRRHVERAIRRNLFRAWMPRLSASEFKVYSFVFSRTLDWQKYAEAIPMQHFLSGINEADGSIGLDNDGVPICSGTGIKKEDTVRQALHGLERRGLITIFKGKRGTLTPANVYMPCAEHYLAVLALTGGAGVLPEHLPRFFTGEHVKAKDDEGIWRVMVLRDGLAHLQRSGGRYLMEDRRQVDPSGIERVSRREWLRHRSGSEDEN